MTREFVYTRTFFANWKEVGFADSDLVRLEEMLIQNPKLGEVIPGTGSARKMRFAYEGRGSEVRRGSSTWTTRSARRFVFSRHTLSRARKT